MSFAQIALWFFFGWIVLPDEPLWVRLSVCVVFVIVHTMLYKPR